MSEKLSMPLKAIGHVCSGIKERKPPGFNWRQVTSEIVIEPELAAGLDGLEEFSHIIVIWWMHLSTDKSKMALKVNPKGRREVEPVGVFSSRSPYRPNPIGRATAKLIERNGNVLRVSGLDALDGTPVLDIKPFIPGYDSVEGATAPLWTQHHR